jgi:tungstate transport system substrate-binding protein
MPSRYQFSLVALCFAMSVFPLSCGKVDDPLRVDLATTTSVVNSGLLDTLRPLFKDVTLRVHAAGSGRSLEMLQDGIVDMVISHAPETEMRYLGEHRDWVYRKLAYNRFIIVGPADDPGDVRDASDAVDAFRRIATSKTAFISRGDNSGTHEREQGLWKAAGVTMSLDRLHLSGQGMAITLRQAHEQQAYTLTDEATFWQLEQQIDLRVLFAGGEQLLNSYSVVHSPRIPAAERLADWLTRGDGRRHIENYRIAGRPAFIVWPSGCLDDTPIAQPCGFEER